MKILFICSEDISLGIASLSAYLKKKGHRTFLAFEPRQFNKSYSENRLLAKFFERDQQILEKVDKLKPDLIGFSVYTANYQWALKLAAKIKKQCKIPIIFGGIHPTLVPEIVIREKNVDIVCIGEGEEALAALLESIEIGKPNYKIENLWFKKGKRVIKNKLSRLLNLSKIPLFDRELFLSELPQSYFKTPAMITSKGCPFSCTFCANNHLRRIYQGCGKYFRRRLSENVIKEALFLKRKYRSSYLIFMDDLFTADLEWLFRFLAEYKRDVKLPYSCFSHFSLFNRKMAKMLKESGCNLVMFGLQSGSPFIRQRILKRYEKNDEVKKVVSYCREYGLKFSLDHIFNLPGDTDQTIKESLSLYNEIRPNVINCFSLIYFPNTEIVNIAHQMKLINRKNLLQIQQGKEIVYNSLKRESVTGDYRKYALLMTAMPLLSKKLVNFVINNKKTLNIFIKLSPILIVPVKFLVYLKTGLSFIFFSVVKNELFYFYKWMSWRLGF